MLGPDEVRRLRHSLDPHAPTWPGSVQLVPTPSRTVGGRHLTLGMPAARLPRARGPEPAGGARVPGGGAPPRTTPSSAARSRWPTATSAAGCHLRRRAGDPPARSERPDPVGAGGLRRRARAVAAGVPRQRRGVIDRDALSLHHHDLVRRGLAADAQGVAGPVARAGLLAPRAVLAACVTSSPERRPPGSWTARCRCDPTRGPVVDLVETHEDDGGRRAPRRAPRRRPAHHRLGPPPDRGHRAVVAGDRRRGARREPPAHRACPRRRRSRACSAWSSPATSSPSRARSRPTTGIDERDDRLGRRCPAGSAATRPCCSPPSSAWPRSTPAGSGRAGAGPTAPRSSTPTAGSFRCTRSPTRCCARARRAAPRRSWSWAMALRELGVDVDEPLWLTREVAGVAADRATQGLLRRLPGPRLASGHRHRPGDAHLRSARGPPACATTTPVRMRGADELRTRMLRVWQGDETDQTSVVPGHRRPQGPVRGADRRLAVAAGAAHRRRPRDPARARRRSPQEAVIHGWLGDRLSTTWLHSPSELLDDPQRGRPDRPRRWASRRCSPHWSLTVAAARSASRTGTPPLIALGGAGCAGDRAGPGPGHGADLEGPRPRRSGPRRRPRSAATPVRRR